MKPKMHENLQSLNTFLIKEIEDLNTSKEGYRGREVRSIDTTNDNSEKITFLIRTIKEHGHLFKEEEHVPEQSTIDLMKSVKKIKELKELSDASEEFGDGELKEVIEIVAVLFKNTGIENLEKSRDTIQEIREVDREIYYQTLAGWIEKNKISLKDLKISKKEILELAPHLTYLNLTDGVHSNFEECTFSEDFIGKLLEKTERLNHLVIIKSKIKGSELSRLKNADQLQTLEISKCFQFNEKLPEGMCKLQTLILSNRQFNQELPKDMHSLQNLKISSEIFNQELPKNMPNLQTLEIKSGFFEKKLPQNMPNLEILMISSESFNQPLSQNMLNLHTLMIESFNFDQQLPNNISNLQTLKITSEEFNQGLPQNMSNLKKLTITSKLFDQELPQNMPNLHTLMIESFNFDQQLPQNMPNLQNLEIFCSNFDQQLPQNMPNLQTLIIESSNFEQKLPENMPNLQTLEIFNYKFNQKLPQKMSKLQILTISSNFFKQKLPEDMHNLQTLEIYCHDFNQKLPHNMSKLQKLIITSELFNQELPEDMHNLQTLGILECKDFNKKLPQNMPSLITLHIEDCPAFKIESAAQLLFNIQRSNPDRAKSVFEPIRNSYDVDKLASLLLYFTHDAYELDDRFFQVLEKVGAVRIIQQLENRNLREFIERNVPYDPIQQLYVYNLCSKTSEDHIEEKLKPFLALVIKNPMDENLKMFYQSTSRVKTLYIPNNISELSKLKHAKRLQSLHYLLEVKSGWDIAFNNILQLHKSNLWADFIQASPLNIFTSKILPNSYLFTGNHNDDSDTIEKLLEVYKLRKDGISKLLEGNDEKIKKTLKSIGGKVWVEEKPVEFLKNKRLQKIIKELYPPHDTQNIALYPIQHTIRYNKYNVLLLVLAIIPEIPLLYPDAILDVLRRWQHKEPQGFFIRHFAGPGIDEGGLSKQFVAQTMQGICTRSKYYQFEKLYSKETGTLSLIPVNAFNPSATMSKKKIQAGFARERENYYLLGKFLGLALNSRCPIGEIFHPKFFDTLYLFRDETLDIESFSVREWLVAQQPQKLLDFIITYLTEVEELESTKELFQKVQQILNAEDFAGASALAKELNLIWFDDNLESALEKKELDNVKKYVALALADIYCGRLEVIQAIAMGMQSELPFKFSNVSVIKWDGIQSVKNKEFADTLQGKLSVDWIKKNLKFEADDQQKAKDLEQWIHRWLDDHKDDPESIRNVVITCTGATALINPITFCMNNEFKGLFPHTCSNHVDVPENIDEEGIRTVFDSWGKEPLLETTQI